MSRVPDSVAVARENLLALLRARREVSGLDIPDEAACAAGVARLLVSGEEDSRRSVRMEIFGCNAVFYIDHGDIDRKELERCIDEAIGTPAVTHHVYGFENHAHSVDHLIGPKTIRARVAARPETHTMVAVVGPIPYSRAKVEQYRTLFPLMEHVNVGPLSSWRLIGEDEARKWSPALSFRLLDERTTRYLGLRAGAFLRTDRSPLEGPIIYRTGILRKADEEEADAPEAPEEDEEEQD